ncbi:hypothetical protein CsatB_015393 [Cannabis sativa]
MAIRTFFSLALFVALTFSSFESSLATRKLLQTTSTISSIPFLPFLSPYLPQLPPIPYLSNAQQSVEKPMALSKDMFTIPRATFGSPPLPAAISATTPTIIPNIFTPPTTTTSNP